MVSKRNKRIGWSQWKTAESLKIIEEYGKYGSLNILYNGDRFLKYRKGSITQFRNQGVVFQFACKNRKKYGCRAVIERIEFASGHPKKYRVSNNIHCDECQGRVKHGNQRNEKFGQPQPLQRPTKTFLPSGNNRYSQSNLPRGNFNKPPPPTALQSSNERRSHHHQRGKLVQHPRKRRSMNEVGMKEMRRRMFQLRKEYNRIYKEYQKRKTNDENRKEWYQVPVPPNQNNISGSRKKMSLKKNHHNLHNRHNYHINNNNDNNNRDFCSHPENNVVQYNFDEVNDNNQEYNCDDDVNTVNLPKIDSLLSPELISSCSSNENIRPEGDWEYYTGFGVGGEDGGGGSNKRYLLN